MEGEAASPIGRSDGERDEHAHQRGHHRARHRRASDLVEQRKTGEGMRVEQHPQHKEVGRDTVWCNDCYVCVRVPNVTELHVTGVNCRNFYQ